MRCRRASCQLAQRLCFHLAPELAREERRDKLAACPTVAVPACSPERGDCDLPVKRDVGCDQPAKRAQAHHSAPTDAVTGATSFRRRRMNPFVLRHFESFTRVSLAMLAFGLGHFSLRLFGPTGGSVAASIIAACGAMMLAYLGRSGVRLDRQAIEPPRE